MGWRFCIVLYRFVSPRGAPAANLGGRQIRKALAQQHFDRADLRQRHSRRMVPSVEVRPGRSIAPVLKKVSVDLLTIAQPLGLRRREQWLLAAEWLSDRHPLFRNGHARQNSNHRSDFDRGRPMIRHDRSIHAMRSQARTLGLCRHCECEVRHSEDGDRLSQPRWGNPNEDGTSRTWAGSPRGEASHSAPLLLSAVPLVPGTLRSAVPRLRTLALEARYHPCAEQPESQSDQRREQHICDVSPNKFNVQTAYDFLLVLLFWRGRGLVGELRGR